MNEPVLGKARPHDFDYKPITWGAFLKLKESAQKVADKFGYPVYFDHYLSLRLSSLLQLHLPF